MAPLTETEGLRTIVAALEGGAAYMADDYARGSGGIGVCLGIGGPGILNMTTALAGARADRNPVLAISGEVPRSWEGMGGFQDASGAAIDDIDAVRPVTGLSISLSSRAVVPHHLRHVGGVVEVVALCGLYSLMGYMTTAFDIPIEPGLPAAF